MNTTYILTLLCAIALSSTTLAQLSSAEIEKVLSMHNNLRASVYPTAADMRQLKWDPKLAAQAQDVVNTCPSDHSNTTNGENMSWGFATLSLDFGIQMWIDEANAYTFSTDFQCRAPECGHYTQMVWSTTEFVGCAMKQCPNMIASVNSPTAGVLVCHYSDAGNYVGQYPYISGATCSQCPAGYGCEAGLCSKSAAPIPAPTTAAPMVRRPTTAPGSTVPTPAPTTVKPIVVVTTAPTSPAPTTPAPTTAAPTRRMVVPTPTTAAPTTAAPTTAAPTTAAPTTAAPTTAAPTTAAPTTAAPTTAAVTPAPTTNKRRPLPPANPISIN